MEEKNEKDLANGTDFEKLIYKAFVEMKGTPLPTDDGRLFCGDIPKSMINRFDWLEADGEE